MLDFDIYILMCSNVENLWRFAKFKDPNQDTEWNDVLRQKGILPPKEVEAEVTEEQIENLVDNVVKEYTSNGNT